MYIKGRYDSLFVDQKATCKVKLFYIQHIKKQSLSMFSLFLRTACMYVLHIYDIFLESKLVVILVSEH